MDPLLTQADLCTSSMSHNQVGKAGSLELGGEVGNQMEHGLGGQGHRPISKSSPCLSQDAMLEETSKVPVNGLAFLSASGGVGLSTLVAITAKILSRRSLTCALVDLDLTGGGMDILVGIEGAPGLRLGQIRAPLGRVDPEALKQELPLWDGIPVLSNDPWNGPPPGWWDVDAALRAMDNFADILLIDAGRGEALPDLRSLRGIPTVLAVDMTVLGVARARALMMRDGILASGGSLGKSSPQGQKTGWGGSPVLIGVLPHSGRASSAVSLEEATDFLGLPVLSLIRPKASLADSIIAGRGLEKIPRFYQRALHALVEKIEDCLPGSGRKIGGRSWE